MRYEFDDIKVDTDLGEVSLGGSSVKIERLVFNLLIFLIEQRHRFVAKDELVDVIWEGRFISDAAISSAIKQARKVIGDNGKIQKYIKTLHGRGFRFVGPVIEVAPVSVAENKGGPPPGVQSDTAQDVRFCDSSDGTGLAYCKTGSGAPVVKVATWMSHIEYDWQSPVWAHILHSLSERNTLLRYDQRGNGLSDWTAGAFGLEAFVADLECVIDASGQDKVVLFGLSQGCAVACEYAARHPDRVRGLILYGGYCRGWKHRDDKETEAQNRAILEIARLGWGEDNPAFRQVFSSLFIPDGTAEQWHWYNDLQRISTTGENAFQIDHALGEIVVTHRLRDVTAPALVMHCRGDAVVPYEEGRMVAKLLPNARFVTLPGRNHIPIESEDAWGQMRDEIAEFLAQFPDETR